MLSTLDLINHYLGYLNVNSKFKGRIYTVLAFFGDAYILYVAMSYLKNHRYVQGSLLMLAFLGILYFAIVNFYYYFTKKTMKFDISPYIAKLLGAEEVKEETAISNEVNRQFVPSNGVYAQKDVLPATVNLDPGMEDELQSLETQLQQANLASNDYGGMTEQQQLSALEQGESTLYANGAGTPLPYYRMASERDGLAVYGGLNEMSAKRLGLITKVGLQPVTEAMQQYDLYIATAVLQGGPAHVKGRAGLTDVREPYILHVELAYQKKG